MLGLHDVGHTALARLAVDSDYGLIAASDVLGIDREIRDFPARVVGRKSLHAFLDRILVRARKRRVDQIADVRMSRLHRQAVAMLRDATQGIDVTQIELRVDPLAEQVHSQVHDVHVAGPFSVAEECALNSVRACHQAELGGCHRGPPVVVRVQGQNHRIPARHIAMEPFDGIAVDVRRVHLHRGRQVQDDRMRRRGLDDVHHRCADLERVVKLGAGEALRRVLVADLRTRDAALLLQTDPCRIDGDLRNAFPVQAEYHPSLQNRGRVVEVDDRPPGALQAFVRPLDQLAPALSQDLDCDVVRNQIILDQLADEVIVGLRGRREPDLDLLEAHRDQGMEHLELPAGVHGVDEGLVAVAQIH